MMPDIHSQTCPNRDELVLYCAGRLDLESSTSISEHVAACSDCESTLNELPETSGSSIFHATDRFDDLFTDPQLKQLRERAKGLDVLWRHDDRAPVPIDSTHSQLQHDQHLTETRTFDDGRRPEPSSPALPEKVGKYFVIKELGQGGFATVYLAKDPEHNRLVAIKVPRADRLTPESSIQRFLSEARTAAELNHSAIVQTYDWGRHGESCFVVMEYVEGKSLQQLLAEQKNVSPEISAKIIASTAEGLHFAHERDVYHRDVKPANILIDRNGKAYLTDFGLALHETDRWRHKDELAGTYSYMSPEQIHGAQRVDERTDIWSLGIVFYQLLTGHRPFSGENKTQLFEDILQRDPRNPRSFEPDVDEELADTCLRCLAKSPADRFATSADLARHLTDWAARQSSAPEPRTNAAPSRRKRLPRIAVAMLCVVFVAALSLVIHKAWQYNPDPLASATIWMHRDPRFEPESSYNRTDSELRATSESETFFSLGTTDEPPFSSACNGFALQVSLRQISASGSVGVFYGGKKSQMKDGRFQFACEMILIEKKGDDFQISRLEKLTWQPDGGLAFSGGEWLAGPEKINVGEGFHSLTIHVTKRGLTSVRWDNNDCDLLIPTPQFNYEGTYGVIVEKGATVFRDFRIDPR